MHFDPRALHGPEVFAAGADDPLQHGRERLVFVVPADHGARHYQEQQGSHDRDYNGRHGII
jgi:hypothetical protein